MVLVESTHPYFDCIYFQADKESMRSLRTSLGYDITFTLLNPQPDMIQTTWDIKRAIDCKMNNPIECQNEHQIKKIIKTYICSYLIHEKRKKIIW